MMKALRLSEDVINDLPESIIEKILMCVPIRDAVRTSILSKKWRYKWATIPKLVFGDNLDEGFSESKILSSVLQVLFLHKGPVLEFSLTLRKVESLSKIDRAILFMSRNGVEKFTLKILKGKHYKLPTSFFSFHQLTGLDLQNCMFKPPLAFKGFSRLKTLNLVEVDIAAEVLHGFISNCPLLEDLRVISSKIIGYRIVDDRKINARRLKKICLNYAFKEKVVGEHSEGANSYLIELFDYLSVSIVSMTLGNLFFQNLVTGSVPKTLQRPLDCLKGLGLVTLCFANPNEISFLLCLIRSSPKLKKITLVMRRLKDGVAVPSQLIDYSGIASNHLVEVSIINFSGMQPEMDFVKFLLVTSPVLVKMKIKPPSESDKFTASGVASLLKLLKLPRASPQAEIVFGDELAISRN